MIHYFVNMLYINQLKITKKTRLGVEFVIFGRANGKRYQASGRLTPQGPLLGSPPQFAGIIISKDPSSLFMAKAKASKKAEKYVYLFGNKKADGNGSMKPLLGGKGANLAEMTR